MTKRTHPHLRLVVDNPEPRKCAQSTSGRIDSQRTSPPDSRSMLIASDSAHDRKPYATLLRCPTLVLHRSAKDLRLAPDMLNQNSLNSMRVYHHTVTERATPNGEFTKRLEPARLDGMEIKQLADIRRENLRRFVDLHLEGNRSELARMVNPDDPNPSYFSDLLRSSSKSFGEKAARRIESAVGLQDRQLDIPDSPLHMDGSKRVPRAPALRKLIDNLTPAEEAELQAVAIDLMKRRKKRVGQR